MRETRDITQPQRGYWLVKAVKNGPRVPAAIFIERDPLFSDMPLDPWSNSETRPTAMWAEIAGEVVDTDEVWLRRGDPITKAEYDFRIADMKYAQTYARDEPQAEPRKPVNWMQAPLPF